MVHDASREYIPHRDVQPMGNRIEHVEGVPDLLDQAENH
jgi:hypothetical protein